MENGPKNEPMKGKYIKRDLRKTRTCKHDIMIILLLCVYTWGGAYIMIILYYFYLYYYYNNISPVTHRLRRSSRAHACVGFPGNKLRGGGASRAPLDDSRRRRPRERSDHAIIAHSFTHTIVLSQSLR